MNVWCICMHIYACECVYVCVCRCDCRVEKCIFQRGWIHPCAVMLWRFSCSPFYSCLKWSISAAIFFFLNICVFRPLGAIKLYVRIIIFLVTTSIEMHMWLHTLEIQYFCIIELRISLASYRLSAHPRDNPIVRSYSYTEYIFAGIF